MIMKCIAWIATLVAVVALIGGTNVLFLYSCSLHKETGNVPNVNCSHEYLYADDSCFLGKPLSLTLADSILAISDSRTDKLLHLLNVKTGQYVGQFISRGQGPNEFRSIATLQKVSGDTLFLHDLNKRECAFFVIPKSNADDIHWLSTFSCRDTPHNSLLPLSNGVYVASGIYEEGRFCLLTDSGRTKKFVGVYPSRDKEEENVPDLVKSQAYAGNITVSPFKDKFVFSTSQADMLSFYMFKNGGIQLIKEVQKSFPEYNYGKDMQQYMGISRHNPIAYLGACATGRFVYLLYSGKSYDEYKLKAFESNQIHVYNWNGEKVKNLVLDVDVNDIVVSEDDKIMYATANLPNPVVVKIEL